MAQAGTQDLTERFIQFYRNYYRDEIGTLAQKYPNEQRSLFVDYDDLYTFDPDLAEDYLNQPEQMREYAEEALRLYDLPADVSLGQAHVRLHNLPSTVDIRSIRVHDNHIGRLVAVQGIIRKATDVRPKIVEAAFECQRCGTMTYIPQSDGSFQEPHECQGCERQGPFRVNFDQSEFIDSQKLRVQESPEGLRGGETPQNIDINVEDDITGEVTAGDHVTVTGVLHIEQQEQGNEKSPIFDLYMDGVSIAVEDEEFEDMDITEEDVEDIYELSNREDIYEAMVDSVAPSIYGYREEKLAMILQLFSGVTKHLPDDSRIRGDLHMLLIGDPGTGKSQLLSYIRNVAPRSVYTSGKGSSSAGLTAAAVRDDFGDGQQWTLEAGALVLADKGIAAIDELDKMRCVTGDTLVRTGDSIRPIRELALDAAQNGSIEELENGRTIRDVDLDVWTMTDDGALVRRDVTAVHEYDAPEELCEVALESGERLTATADHPFFTLDGGERTETAAEELDEGDWVYVPNTLSQRATDGGVGARVSDSGAATFEDDLSPARGGILGYLAGDGNIYYNREEGSYGIRFTNAEEELLADFERVCSEAFDGTPVRHPSEQRDDGAETVRLHGKEYVDELLGAGANLEIYDGKRLAERVAGASRETKAAFLRALADAEGTVDERSVKIFSSSYELLLGAKMLLLEFGVTGQIQTRKREEGRDVHALVITADESLAAFRDQVGFALDRKQTALEAASERTDGDRTILDVIPDSGELFEEARNSLRLHQAECGLNDVTYCNFENGDANISLHRAETVLERFEERRAQASRDSERFDTPCSWERLSTLKERYHISQAELATGTPYSQPQISRYWGEDDLRETVQRRVSEIVESVAETEFARLASLIRGDVKWRRVADVSRVPANASDDRLPVLRERLTDIVGGETETAVDRAWTLLDERSTPTTWDELRTESERYGISFQQIAAEFDVAGSTISRWFSRDVDGEGFEVVRERCDDLIDAKRSRIRTVLDKYETRRERVRTPKVYDLTVEGTHNFVANGMVVHNSEDRSAMHEALEQQQISVSKAGINATLKSRCSLLGAANPKYGRFDQYEPIGEQIDLEPALISRFDLIFTVTDQPDEEKDANLAEHIIQTNYAGELNTQRSKLTNANFSQEEVDSVTDNVAPEIDPELMRKYIAYAKRNCFPAMTEKAKEAIRDFYVNLRAKGADEDAPVPVTARKLEALVRLSEASARVRLSDTVEQQDADRVIEIVRSCLQDIGVDPETGEFDADVVETGTSKTQRDRKMNLRKLIGEIEDEYEEGAPVEEVVEQARDVLDIDESKAEKEIENLKRKGELYEPSQNHLRTT